MSQKNSGRPSTATSKLHVVADDPSSYVPTTDAGKSLWAVLQEHPDSSAAELAIAAGIGKSTAPKLLIQWLTEGRVTKTPGIARGGTRVADRWAIGAPTPEAAMEPTGPHHAIEDPASTTVSAKPPVDPSADASAGADPTEQSADAVTADVPEAPATEENVAGASIVGSPPAMLGDKKNRLSKGGLHGLVEDLFQEHPGEPLGPSAISTKLQRSSGAVANACVRLVEKGVLVRTQDSPKRYALAAHD